MPKGKKFLNLTWQQIIGSIVGLVVVGAASFVGVAIHSAIEKVDKHETEIVAVQKDVENLSGTLGSTTATVSITAEEIQTLREAVVKLSTIVERLEAPR